MVIMLGCPLVYCALKFSFDFYLTGSSIYVYMSDLVGRWIATGLDTPARRLGPMNGFLGNGTLYKEESFITWRFNQSIVSIYVSMTESDFFLFLEGNSPFLTRRNCATTGISAIPRERNRAELTRRCKKKKIRRKI
jgi:hypothetical protein